MNRNKKVLDDFVKFCEENPNLRFWQALRNWCGYNWVLVSNDLGGKKAKDTFYWEEKNGN